jgi:hypothetical protein
MKEVTGGVYKQLNRTARWICLDCLEKRSESIYRNRSGKVADVAKIMADLQRRQAWR